ncbi:amidase family protein [Pseudoroseomonas wenyumeiae]
MTDFWRLTATETAARVAARDISAREVTQAALDRLAAVNPAINAVVQEMPEEALAAADAVDAAIARGEKPGLLAGVPVTIKVNVDQKGFATTNGLRIQAELMATEDNPVVANFRRAGAVIIGRTNTPAFSLRWFTRNGLHGHTRNPRDPSRTPGGSSGGAAAAVAAGIGAIGHGTDIGGSVRYPAYACGIHGLRPTLGRVPAWNPSGAERAIGAQLMAVSAPSPAPSPISACRWKPWLPRTCATLVGAGAAAQRPLSEARRPLRAAGRAGHQAGGGARPARRRPAPAGRRLEHRGNHLPAAARPGGLAGAALAGREPPHRRRGPAAEADPDAAFVFAQMEALCPNADFPAFQDALQARATYTRQWQLFLKNYPVLLTPVSSELPFPDLLDIESPEAFRRVMEAQLVQVGLPLMGLPGLTVATGAVDGVPVGVQLIGGRYREDVLLDAGAIIEAGGPMIEVAEPAPL